MPPALESNITMNTVSVTTAIWRGRLQVYGPFFPCVLGVPGGAILLHLPSSVVGISFLLGIILAWVWWSYQTPRWRLWALQHVDDIAKLHQTAVAVGIEWPYGSIFEYTEIKPYALQYEETKRLAHYYLLQFARLLDQEHQEPSTSALVTTIHQLLQQLEATPFDRAAVLQHLQALESALHTWFLQSPRAAASNLRSPIHAVYYVIKRLKQLSQKQTLMARAG